MGPSILQYDSTHPLYGIAFSNSPAHPHRIVLSSFLTGPSNKIFIVEPTTGPAPYGGGYASPARDFGLVAQAPLALPATKVAWEPAASAARHDGLGGRGELLATSGDVLRIWEVARWEDDRARGFVRNGYEEGYALKERSVLSNSKQTTSLPPITSFSWNATAANSIVTCSSDTTATVWDINTSQALTQLIAHDRAVYDLSWLPQSTDIFVSVGADGSLRAFDLRQLEHSTILYETPNQTALARIAFSNREQHMLACFAMDDSRVLILDMRSPGQPVAELHGHQAAVGAIAWGAGGNGGASSGGWLASCGDDSQLLMYDLTSPLPTPAPSGRSSARPSTAAYALSPPRTPTRTPSPARAAVEVQPARGWTAKQEINNLAFSSAGDWVGCVAGQRLSVLQA
ncbi:hypothetical protein Q5752_004006 [Cryptotrichosporon argae]